MICVVIVIGVVVSVVKGVRLVFRFLVVVVMVGSVLCVLSVE